MQALPVPASTAKRCAAPGWLWIVAGLALACRPAGISEEEAPHRPVEVPADGYVSSDPCAACHPRQYATWDASYHSSMTQLPSPDTVRAPWHGVGMRFAWSYQLERRGDAYWARSDDPRWSEPAGASPPGERRISLVTGSHHEQFYWYATGDTRKLALFPLVYRIRERRWVPYQAVLLTPQVISPERVGDWNTVCLRCHTTHGRPGAEWVDGRRAGMDTRVAEFGIACEACHGPADDHVQHNRNPLLRYRNHFDDEPDPTIVNPARLSSRRSAEVCGSCHSIYMLGSRERDQAFLAHGLAYRPGDELGKTRFVARYRDREHPEARFGAGRDPLYFEDRFWRDGMPSTSGRELTALLESGCYQRGELSCLSCHRMHPPQDDPRPLEAWADDQLEHGMQGDGACLQCHAGYGAGTAAHTHHLPGSSGSRCTNCHMPNTAYGLLKQTRSHLIDSPSVANALATGRPTACNLCHLDRTLAWTAETLQRWYDRELPPLSGPDQTVTSDAVVRALTGDAGLRAMIAWHMGWGPAREASGGDWMAPLLAQLLEDPYMAVRYIAGESLRAQPDWSDLEYDYLALPQQLRAAHAAALARWERRAAPGPRATGAAILIDEQGALLRERFRELLARRDDRPVYRAE